MTHVLPGLHSAAYRVGDELRLRRGAHDADRLGPQATPARDAATRGDSGPGLQLRVRLPLVQHIERLLDGSASEKTVAYRVKGMDDGIRSRKEHRDDLPRHGLKTAESLGVQLPKCLARKHAAKGEPKDFDRRVRSAGYRYEDALTGFELELAEALRVIVLVGDDGCHRGLPWCALSVRGEREYPRLDDLVVESGVLKCVLKNKLGSRALDRTRKGETEQENPGTDPPADPDKAGNRSRNERIQAHVQKMCAAWKRRGRTLEFTI